MMSSKKFISGRRWGWDGLREQHWNMYITLCKIDDHCKFRAWGRAPKPMLCDNAEEWGGEGGGKGVQDGGGTQVYLSLIHDGVWQKSPQYFKVIILQLK